jgi:hypothetical protein
VRVERQGTEAPACELRQMRAGLVFPAELTPPDYLEGHRGPGNVLRASEGYAADYRTTDGGVRLRNVSRYVVARA